MNKLVMLDLEGRDGEKKSGQDHSFDHKLRGEEGIGGRD